MGFRCSDPESRHRLSGDRAVGGGMVAGDFRERHGAQCFGERAYCRARARLDPATLRMF